MQPEPTIPRPVINEDVQRIVLIGFMGAGKSTVGPLLAEKLAWSFTDVDQHLQHQTGSTIANLFTEIGEPAFRRMEAAAISSLLAQPRQVLSLGGGAVETESTRSLLQASPQTCVVFLSAPLDIMIERCEREPGAAVRPVLHQRDALHRRFHARLPHYQSAHLTVDTERLHPENVADEILSRISEISFALPVPLPQPEKAATI